MVEGLQSTPLTCLQYNNFYCHHTEDFQYCTYHTRCSHRIDDHQYFNCALVILTMIIVTISTGYHDLYKNIMVMLLISHYCIEHNISYTIMFHILYSISLYFISVTTTGPKNHYYNIFCQCTVQWTLFISSDSWGFPLLNWFSHLIARTYDDMIFANQSVPILDIVQLSPNHFTSCHNLVNWFISNNK